MPFTGETGYSVHLVKLVVAGVLTVSACVGGLTIALRVGADRFAAVPTSTKASAPTLNLTDALAQGVHQPISQLLMQLVVIIGAAHLLGALFERIHQPAVVGEMVGGLALGPTFFGALFPRASAFVFPPSGMGTLQLLSQVGIVLFMFVVGMELDLSFLRKNATAAIFISQVSIAAPFLLGATLSIFLFESYAPPTATFTSFALFLGLSMSITAFPVLARIIKERGLDGTTIAATAISCAAIGDVSAWCILAFIVATAKSRDLSSSLLTLVLSAVFLAVAFSVVKPTLERLSTKHDDGKAPNQGLVVVCVLVLLSSAFFTEAIGIHALFGAFVAGLAMPNRESLREFLRERFEYVSAVMLMPVFFALTGLRTRVDFTTDLHSLGPLLAILAVAIIGKFGSSMLAARYCGMSWRESTATGALMNTRGLIELIALNVGLDLGILSRDIYALLVIMALVTTILAGPAIRALGFDRRAAPRIQST